MNKKQVIILVVVLLIIAGVVAGLYFGGVFGKKASPTPTPTPRATQPAPSQTQNDVREGEYGPDSEFMKLPGADKALILVKRNGDKFNIYMCQDKEVQNFFSVGPSQIPYTLDEDDKVYLTRITGGVINIEMRKVGLMTISAVWRQTTLPQTLTGAEGTYYTDITNRNHQGRSLKLEKVFGRYVLHSLSYLGPEVIQFVPNQLPVHIQTIQDEKHFFVVQITQNSIVTEERQDPTVANPVKTTWTIRQPVIQLGRYDPDPVFESMFQQYYLVLSRPTTETYKVEAFQGTAKENEVSFRVSELPKQLSGTMYVVSVDQGCIVFEDRSQSNLKVGFLWKSS
jgi:hypothetical protein